MGRPSKYSLELRERAVRLARESERGIAPVARGLGLTPGTLRGWVRQAEADEGPPAGSPHVSVEREELAALRREVRELLRSNEILKVASVFFAGDLDQPSTK